MQWLIYGANGYTGQLIARAAAARGLRPILAGRNAAAVSGLALELGLMQRVFSLAEPAASAAQIQDVGVVLHCAGPFAHTAQPMADACLRCGVHYLDITGEIDVFEALAARNAEARAARVMLLPGVGFDVVPSDCLAVHLQRRLPGATKLALGILGTSTSRLSRGTATTVVENLQRGGLVRRREKVTRVPAAWKTRVIDFGTGPVKAITIPWGDVSTAYHSTGIPNIEVYMSVPFASRLAAHASRFLGPLLGRPGVQEFLKRKIRAGPPGPTDSERASGRSYLWGEATDNAGRRVVARLQGPEGYTLTVQAALAIVERVLTGAAAPGFQTPAKLFGPDFVLGLPGITRQDEDGKIERQAMVQ